MIKKLLTIDNGNTNPHVGIFHDDELAEVITLVELIENIERYQDYKAVLSSVGKNLEHTQLDFLEISPIKQNNLFLDMPFRYSETIGDDRLFQAYFVFKNFIRNDLEKILLIDAGTFTTVDIIDTKGFQGGYIFPGVQTFLNSYSRGKLLPVYETKDINIEHKEDLPDNTQDAITMATKIFVKETLQSIVNQTSPAAIIITGGHLDLVHDLLKEKNKGPIIMDPNLIHFSLKEIAIKLAD
jgi:type III pantothenate kinase